LNRGRQKWTGWKVGEGECVGTWGPDQMVCGFCGDVHTIENVGWVQSACQFICDECASVRLAAADEGEQYAVTAFWLAPPASTFSDDAYSAACEQLRDLEPRPMWW